MAQNETPEPAGLLPAAERTLLLQYLDGYQMYAVVNGRRFTVLYSSRHTGDPMPWIYLVDPATRFVNEVVTANVLCQVCGTNVDPGARFHPDVLRVRLCETHMVNELAGDLVQVERGTMK